VHEIILHHYPRAPHAEKVRLALGMKELAYRSVTIPSWMPKPDLVALTGGYRRTPVMQVGADIFCDTLIILHEIERMHPAPSLFPDGCGRLATLLGRGIEKAIFNAAIGVIVALTGQNYPRELVEDRLRFFGFSIAHADMLPQQALFVDRLNAHLVWLGDLLADGRAFLLGSRPSAADLCAYHPLWHLRRAGGDATAADRVLELLPTMHPLLRWMDRCAAIGHGSPQDMPAAEALRVAAAATPLPCESDAAAPLSGLLTGDPIRVTPDDTGRDPVIGRLVAMTRDEIVLGRQDERLGAVNVHFPRTGFDVERIQDAARRRV
jgi:glutathione S-transferase